MLTLFLRALLLWVSCLELLAGLRGWWGLAWLGRGAPRLLLLPLALATLARLRRGGWRAGLALALASLPALLLQIAAGSLRNRALNPLLRLLPGSYPDRSIARFDIPMREGYLPALHVAPAGGSDVAICVIHGSGCDKTAYVWRLVDTLIGRGMAVLLIDLDGHGENPRPQSFPAILEDVDVAVRWLRERYERVGVIGISLGGCVAARAVADEVQVDALAVLEAPPALSYTQADVRREALALANPRLLGVFDNCTAYHMVRAWEFAPIRATIGTWDLIAACDLTGSLARISAPLLLIYGSRDAIVKPIQAEQARRAAPPGATFRLVPGASHLTLILAPEALRTIGEWLTSVFSASPKIPFDPHAETRRRAGVQIGS